MAPGGLRRTSRVALGFCCAAAAAAAGASAAAQGGACAWDLSPADHYHPYATCVAKPPLTTGAAFDDLPGFTRSVYERDHMLLAPESRVYGALTGWPGASAAVVTSPAMGAHFVMSLVDLPAGAAAQPLPQGVERAAFVLNGTAAAAERAGAARAELAADSFAYFPPGSQGELVAGDAGASLVVFERKHVPQPGAGSPAFHTGTTDERPALETPGEIFGLKKLLPTTPEYDFNLHIMDFQPGEYLNVKELHYNQHGLLLLEGKGVYRLGERWYTVKAGDVIWMAPFVTQWYAALGTTRSRYILYKDTNRDPLDHKWVS